jgi:hypothetical protein
MGREKERRLFEKSLFDNGRNGFLDATTVRDGLPTSRRRCNQLLYNSISKVIALLFGSIIACLTSIQQTEIAKNLPPNVFVFGTSKQVPNVIPISIEEIASVFCIEEEASSVAPETTPETATTKAKAKTKLTNPNHHEKSEAHVEKNPPQARSETRHRKALRPVVPRGVLGPLVLPVGRLWGRARRPDTPGGSRGHLVL